MSEIRRNSRLYFTPYKYDIKRTSYVRHHFCKLIGPNNETISVILSLQRKEQDVEQTGLLK
jgi:hypothetical protein